MYFTNSQIFDIHRPETSSIYSPVGLNGAVKCRSTGTEVGTKEGECNRKEQRRDVGDGKENSPSQEDLSSPKHFLSESPQLWGKHDPLS